MRVLVQADGGSRGNPGPAGYGAVVLDADTGATLAERKAAIGIDTNNVAEYQGLIAGLAAARELGATDVDVQMDSKLVVEQMSGRWQVKHPSMRPLARQAAELAAGFDRIRFEWIPRARNGHADRLANEAMDAAAMPAAPVGSAREPVGSARAEPVQEQLPANNLGAWVPPQAVPTRLLLVRHGVTEYSVAKRFAGRSDLELTEAGREQARRAAGRVAELGPVDVLISSPLRRTRQTADQLADQLELPVLIEDGMVETDFGDWDGYTYAEVSQKWPAELQRWLADPSVAPPSGESFETVTRRVRQARDRILAQHGGKTVVVVSHVSPIKTLVRLALDAPASALQRMFLEPASISVIDYYADGPVSLRSFNDTAHLGALAD
ncbi:MAG TPA: bifunctional RNase H/acid phosphatase [Jatrophihabitans sp.]|jgi:broad specificity phosphatase PhoE/ribonuclease HI|uniref:bifunctional RNase H/acid phosphatase n=1 Tax=Jatrophihabitans sp. TaxID=1932789 RepID=UPI002F25948F